MFEVLLVCVEDASGIKSWDWCCKDGVCFVVVHYEKTNVAVKGQVGEFAGAVTVDDTRDFVCKCAKTEHIGDGLAIVVVNDVVCWAVWESRRRRGDRGVR